MKKWQEAYEGILGEVMASDKVKSMDNWLDKTLMEHLPEEVFNEVYDQVADLEAIHNEAGFKYGYMMGFLTCLNVDDIDSFELKSDEAGDPVFSIKIKSAGTYEFEVTNGLAISIVNSFLVNFEDHSKVNFKNYDQYGYFIRRCNQRLQMSHNIKATA